MGTSIFEVNALLGGPAQATAAPPQTTTTPAAPTVQHPTKIDPSVDTVKLSEGARVRESHTPPPPRRILPLPPLKNIFRPPQSFLHVVANVFVSDHIFKFG